MSLNPSMLRRQLKLSLSWAGALLTRLLKVCIDSLPSCVFRPRAVVVASHVSSAILVCSGCILSRDPVGLCPVMLVQDSPLTSVHGVLQQENYSLQNCSSLKEKQVQN